MAELLPQRVLVRRIGILDPVFCSVQIADVADRDTGLAGLDMIPPRMIAKADAGDPVVAAVLFAAATAVALQHTLEAMALEDLLQAGGSESAYLATRK